MSIFREIEQERNRQVNTKGWTTAHDDHHNKGELAMAAAFYAAPGPLYVTEDALHEARDRLLEPNGADLEDMWPFKTIEAFGKGDRRRQLIKAAALLVAEIERLDRLKR